MKSMRRHATPELGRGRVSFVRKGIRHRPLLAFCLVAAMLISTLGGVFLLLTGNANAAAFTRIQSSTGTGTNSISVTISAPADGNALIAVVGTRGTTAGAGVTSITQTGATWVRAGTQSVNSGGATVEVWYALNVSSASTSISIATGSTASSSAVVAEYSGIASASAVDKTANSTGNSATLISGTTATTTATDELWIGGFGSATNTAFSSPTQSFSIVNQTTVGGSPGARQATGMSEKIVTATGAATTGVTGGSAAWGGIIVTFKPAPTFGMSAYRLFANADSTDVGSPLAAQNTGYTLTSTGQIFRLRLLIGVTLANLGLSGQNFKLQYRTVGTGCDSSGSWTDVTTSTAIAYYNNATPTDGSALTANASDPTGGTVRNQTYEELNNFTNSQLAISAGESGKWDFSLKDNGAPADTSYCIRAANSTGAPLSNDTIYPVVSTKGSDAILKQEQFDGVRTLLATGASTSDGVSTPLYFDQYMHSASSTDVLVPTLEIKAVGTAFTNTATHTGDAVAYDPDIPYDTRHSCSAYDSANQQMVTWGGVAGEATKDNINDAWTISLKAGQRSQWKKLAPTGTKPQATRAHVCVYDSLNQRLIVFGGWDGTNYLTTPWALTLPTDGSTPAWSQLTTAGTAMTNFQVLSGMAVYDPSPSRMIMYGGFTGSTDITPNVYQLTLPSSGTPTWSDIGLTTGASASTVGRDSATMVYDAQNDRAILFGGIHGVSTYYNEAWSLNLAAGSEAWTLLSPTGTAPAARDGQFAAWQTDYNANGDDRMVIFGGQNGSYMSDVWELRVPSGGGTPSWVDSTPGGSGGTMQPSLRAWGAQPGVYDPVNKRALFAYGYDGGTDAYNNEAVAFDLKNTSGTLSFYNLNDERGLHAHDGAIMVYDPNNKQMMMHGGAWGGANNTTSYAYHLGTTWKLDTTTPTGWVDANSDLAPFKREFGASAYDTVNNRIVYCLGLHNAATYPTDCWQTPSSSSGKANWTQLFTNGTAPPGRYVVSTVYDTANNRMVVFGGSGSSAAFNELDYLTFTSGSATWSTPTTSGTAPAARWGAHAVYDPVRQRMIVFGGVNYNSTTFYNDVWEVSLPSSGTPTWRQMSPTGTAPTARRGGSVVYDPDRGDGTPRMIMFGGVDSSSAHYNDVWELTIPSSGDGVWTQLSPSGTAPAVRRSQGSAYDPVNDRMIIYGGRNASSFYNDTFSLSLGTSPAWSTLSSAYYIPGTVKVTGLTDNTSYHWQGWTSGSISGTSQKFSYGGNAESAADFTVSSNSPPASPTPTAQNRVTGGASVSTGGWTNENQINLSATATDPDTSDTLQLCVEKQPIGTNFTGTGEVCGTGVAYSGSTVTPTVTLTGLSEGEYHWQARIKDAAGAYSSWVSYGGNAETVRDFGVDLSAPTGTVYDGTTTSVDASYNDGSLTSLSANWNISSSISGLSTYEYSIGTTAGGTDVAGWTSVGTDTSVTATSLSLSTSQPYYFNIRITDNAGNISTISSNGQLVAPTLGFSVSTNTVTFPAVNAGNSYTATANVGLTITTNAKNGYQVKASATQDLTDAASRIIGMFSGGTYAAPAAWGSNTGFGYNSSDTSVGGSNRFNSATCPGGGSAPCYAPYNKTLPGDVIVDGTAPATTGDAYTISNRITVTPQQAAGNYTTTLTYSANAIY